MYSYGFGKSFKTCNLYVATLFQDQLINNKFLNKCPTDARYN